MLGIGLSSLIVALLIGLRSTFIWNMAGGALGTGSRAATHSKLRMGRTRFPPSNPAHVSDKKLVFVADGGAAYFNLALRGIRMGNMLQRGLSVSFEEKT